MVADMLQSGAEWLEAQRIAHMARTVTYRRGADSVEVSATIGRTLFEVDRDAGINVELETRDYLIATSALVLAAATVLPQAGDEILEVEGATQFVYEVLAPTGTEPAWRYSDPYRFALRIHTKLVRTEPVA